MADRLKQLREDRERIEDLHTFWLSIATDGNPEACRSLALAQRLLAECDRQIAEEVARG
jgi:hypothetical protein